MSTDGNNGIEAGSPQRALAAMVARGIPPTRAAPVLGMNARTARHWATRPRFKALVASFRRDAIELAHGTLAHNARKAALVLVELLTSDERPDVMNARRGAAQAILASLGTMDAAEMESRFEAIEERLRGQL